jgi:hypothetical protein
VQEKKLLDQVSGAVKFFVTSEWQKILKWSIPDYLQ